jgi:hypothetical protein
VSSGEHGKKLSGRHETLTRTHKRHERRLTLPPSSATSNGNNSPYFRRNREISSLRFRVRYGRCSRTSSGLNYVVKAIATLEAVLQWHRRTET